MFITLQSAFAVLLRRWSNKKDILMGTPVANRSLKEVQGLIGMFVNTLVLRNKVNDDASFLSFMQQNKEEIMQAFEYQDYPFNLLVEDINPERELGHSPVFQIMFALENSKEASRAFSDEVEIKKVKKAYYSSKFDLTLYMSQKEEDILVEWEYDTNLFESKTIHRIAESYVNVLESIVDNPDKPVKRLDFSSSGLKEKVLSLSKGKEQAVDNICVHTSFEEQVVKNPDAVALEYLNTKISYQELNRKANKIAHYLIDLGVKKGDFVIIRTQRSAETFLCILAVLKVGGVYLPVDSGMPEGRMKHILQNSKADFIISDSSSDEEAFKDYQLINIKNEEVTVAIQKQLETNIKVDTLPADLAYSIYTSGSSGLPKGCLIEHRNVQNLLLSNRHVLNITSNSRILQFASISFDASVFEWVNALTSGSTLVIVPEEIRTIPEALSSFIKTKNITHALIPPILIPNLNPDDFKNITSLVIGGESWNMEMIKDWKGICNIYNAYGPSEASVITSIEKVEIKEGELLNIGRPIFNTESFVLNEHLDLQPPGAVGELYIGGASVGRGYLNNEELTGKSFILSPFNKTQRLYKTGDLVRWNNQGKLEFIGRSDKQVKVRGYRIELGEIKENIEKCNGVNLAHILVVRNKFQVNEIIAFIEARKEIDATSIEETVSDFLPSYMLPSRYTFIEQLPMTINGKVDEKELRKTDLFTVAENIVLPKSETEKKIAAIWAVLLGEKNKISVKENFFRMGGHSLTIARLLGELKKSFNIQIELKDLYINPSIEKQAKLVENSEKLAFKSVEPVKPAANYILSSSQRRLWVLCRFPNVNRAYNISNIKQINGKLHAEILDKAFVSCILRHESLRTNFSEDIDGTLRQTIQAEDSVRFSVECHNIVNKKNNTAKIIGDFTNRIFDLSSDLMIRAQLIQVKEEQWILQYVIHHIAADGWSIDILENELKLFYNAIHQNEEPNLPALELQYKDYANWQQNTLKSPQGEADLAFWKAQFNNTFPLLDLPADFSRPKIKSYKGYSEVFKIENNLLEWLHPVLKEEEATLFMGLTAVLNIFLYKYSGQNDIILGVPVAGRDHVDLNNQVGFYVNTIALRTQFEEKNSFIDVLNIVKQNMLAGYAHQMYPIDELLDHINIERDTSRNALFDVMIAFQDLDEDKKEVLNFNGTQTVSYTEEERDYSLLDLTFSFVKSNSGLQLEVEYDTDLFSSETIARMADNFLFLIKSIGSNTNLEINKLETVTQKEKNILLHEFNKPIVSKKYKALKDLFETTVKAFPDQRAVVYNTKELTYAQLNKKANQFAAYLKKKHKITAKDLLVIHMEKTEKLLISVLASAKMGAAYVTADINAPEDRLNYILEDTNAQLLIDEKLYRSFVKGENQYSGKNIKISIAEDSPFTIIYTSGTTGKPKGSIITNKNIASRIQTEVKLLNKRSKIVTVNTTNAAFDVCLLEFFLPLLNGGSILIPTKAQNDSHYDLTTAIKKYKVNVLQGTPGFIQLIFQDVATAKMLKGLTHICIGGESLNNTLVQRIKQILPEVKVNNHFGPTETTIDAVVNKNLSSFERNIIGKPIPQTRVFIVNSENILVPLGAVGELCIAGEGVTSGYLNNEALTSEKFIDFPLSKEKIYKTGDLCRWLPDGNIEFIGRKDLQIKIRGYRVELKEIEHVLIENENILDAALIVRENELKNKEIIAFVVLDKKMKSHEIKRHLKSKLSFYMIPNHIVELPSIPLTINGKKDYKFLDVMLSKDKPRFIVDELRTPNEIDQQILKIWGELLKTDTVKIDDNFFSLGGNSIMIIEINNRLKSIFSMNFDISTFYEYTSIIELSDFIAGKINAKNTEYVDRKEHADDEMEILNF